MSVRLKRWILAAALASPLAVAGRVAAAQGSGTMLSQTVTVIRGAANPIFEFEVRGFKGEGSTTLIMLEIGPDGFDPSPAVRAPNPSLPASTRFIVRQGGTSHDFTPPALGSTGTAVFAGKNVAVDRSGEFATEPRGFYRVTIGHLGEIADGAVETWSLELTNLPAGLRVIASISSGNFINLDPAGAVCAGATCPAGQACQAPCPGVCPVGQSCRGACPRLPCLGPWRFYEVEIVWPRRFPPGPWPCLQCPEPWKENFDPSEFERVIVTWRPTDEQRMAFERGQAPDVRFDVTGGQTIGTVLEGSQGEFIQLVQYPRGQPPMVSVLSNGQSVGQFRADKREFQQGGGGRDRGLLYGLLGLILGAVGSWFAARGRGGAGPKP